MRSGILRTYVATLRLRRDAPFPSQVRAREKYQMKARKTVKYAYASGASPARTAAQASAVRRSIGTGRPVPQERPRSIA